MNGKRAIKQHGANHPVKKSLRVVKAKIAERNWREVKDGESK